MGTPLWEELDFQSHCEAIKDTGGLAGDREQPHRRERVPTWSRAKPPTMASPTAAHRARADYRRGFASDGHRESPGTPRYNLLQSLGGLY